MIKQITNLKGTTIYMNNIVDGNGITLLNLDTFTLKTGKKMLVKFDGIVLASIAKVGSAKFLLPVEGNGTFEIEVFKNTNAYSATSVNYTNDPDYDDAIHYHYEKFTIGKSGGYPELKMIEMDLTALFAQWKNEGTTNLSFTIVCTSTATLTAYGYTNNVLEGRKLFSLSYANTNTFSNAYDYVTDEVSFGGKSFVNTFTGRLAHQFDVFQTDSKKLPIKFSLNYIERLTGVTMKNSLLGNWRTNFDFGFKFETDTITIASPEGGIAYFEKTLREDAARFGIYIGTKTHCFINFIDNSYIVLHVYQNGYQTYKMYDATGNIYLFNSNKQLLSITKEDGNSISFGYDSSFKVTSISSDDGYLVTLSYDGTKVRYVNFIEEDKRIKLSYSSYGIEQVILQQLKRTVSYTGTVITYSDLVSTTFEHSAYLLTRVNNNTTLEGLYFEYSGSKVIKLSNTIKDGFTYLIDGYRTLNYYSTYTKVSDHDNNTQYTVHDNFGMLLQSIDKYGNSESKKYQSVGMDGIARRASDNSGWIPNSKSSIIDSSFELVEFEGLSTSSLGWKSSSTSEYVQSCNDSVRGKYALKIKGGNNAQVYQILKSVPSISFGISFLAKTLNFVGSAEAKISITYKQKIEVSLFDVLVNGAHYDIKEGNTYYILVPTSIVRTVTIGDTNGKWLPFEIANIAYNHFYSLLSATLYIRGIHTSGDLIVDAMKLSSEELIGSQNMLIATDMETSSGVPGGFTKSSNCTSSDMIVSATESYPYSKIIGSKRFRFTSAIGTIKSIERNIQLKGSSGETLTFSFWGKSIFNNGSKLNGAIIFRKGNEIVQKVEIAADNAINNWQLVSTSVVTKRPYDNVSLMIEYTGVNECLVDSIGLYRDAFGSQYKYNEKGNLLEEADNASSKNYKSDGSKIVESNDESGEQYKYIYNNHGKVSKVIDTKGNSIDLSYDENDNRTKSKINNNNETLELSNTFNADNQVLTTTDELNHVTSFTYDSLKRLRTRTEANGLVTTNSYDELNNLIAIVKSKSGDTISASYQYYDNNLLQKITCDNGTAYEFYYDDFGRVEEITLNGTSFVSYEYGLQSNGIVLDNITKQTIGSDIYTFSYDAKRRLSQVKLNGNSMATYEYDSDSNIYKKSFGANTSYFDYDTEGKLIRETRNSGDSLSYDYDNLGQLQKAIYDINEMKRTYDFEYLNEYNEYNAENVKTRVDKAFNDDIVDYNALTSGLHGVRVDSAWGSKVTYNDKKVFSLNKKTSKIIYSLDTINSSRIVNNTGGNFDRAQWNSQFEDSKTMFGWFRFTETIPTSYKRIFGFGDESEDKYYVAMYKYGSFFRFRLYSGTTSIVTKQILATTDLIFIGLRLYRSGVNQTSYVFTVNQTSSSSTISSGVYVSKLSKLVLGDRTVTSGSMESNPFIEDIALISIGAYPYTNDVFQAIQNQESRFQNMNIKQKTGVSFVNQNTYEDFEVVSLNGTFKSTKGRMPSDYEYIDGTFKLDKTKLFKYDESLERHVYGSYPSAQGFGLVKGLLAYEHDLTNYGVVAINFKMEGTSSINRTIFDFRNDTISKLKIYRNSAGNASLVVDGTTHYTDLPIAINQWNRILVTFAYQGSSSQIKVYLNDYSINRTITATADVTNTKLIVGSSLLNDGTPIEHLDGVLEMLATKQTYWSGNSTGINRVVKGEQQLSVKTEIDLMGRSYKDIIDTGIPEVNLQTTKQLVSQYGYKENGLDDQGLTKTSLQVSNVQGFDGYNKEYAYDSMGNIEKITIKDDNDIPVDEYEYIYDKLSRLKEEYNLNLNQTIVYSYGFNNNISAVTYYQGRKVSLLKTETYHYNGIYKDQLDSISTEESGVTTTKAINYNTNNLPNNFLGNTLGWQGRRLTSINGDMIEYQYNDAGIRTSKEVNEVITKYHLIGDKVGALTKGSSKLFFHYNERDMLVGLEYDKENYFYSRDLTGNITSIVDKNGSIMVEYKYDAWGKWLNQLTAAKTPIGETLLSLNPFLYKGYIYDLESGFYYLKSRYYSPEVRRFISVDTEIGDVGNLENYNLFAYCNNNPVIGYDPMGNWNWGTFWRGVGLVATGVVAVVVAVGTFGAGTPLAIGLVAAVTVTAGTLTTINGVATIIEAGTDYNIIRDEVFNKALGLSDEAYYKYEQITETIAIIGTMICGAYRSSGRGKAAKKAREKLGKDYNKVGKNRWMSKDGTKQMRFDTSKHMYKGKRTKFHFNIDYFKNNSTKIKEKIHIFYDWIRMWIE